MKPAITLISAALLLGACATAPMYAGGPPPPRYGAAPTVFQPSDFAWSTAPGSGSILGSLAYRDGPARYSCDGGDVLLTPETPWSRRRMIILYGSAASAAVPVGIVRARTPSAPSGDYARYVRKTTCDADGHFAFTGLPDGGWFVITVARPVDDPAGEPIAVTRRVQTRGGARTVILN
ncbi:MAG: hypothetical protein ABI376_08535 [Caulobacteraceae bacterium]